MRDHRKRTVPAQKYQQLHQKIQLFQIGLRQGGEPTLYQFCLKRLYTGLHIPADSFRYRCCAHVDGELAIARGMTQTVSISTPSTCGDKTIKDVATAVDMEKTVLLPALHE